MEAKLAKRIAAAGVISALTIAGCSTEKQINDKNIVNCTSEQKSGELKTNLPFGQRIEIAGTGSGFDNESPFYISIEKGKGVSIQNDDGRKIIYFPSNEPQLAPNEAGIDKNGTIFIRGRSIDYKINSTVDNNGGTLDIKATCIPQQ